MTEARSTYPLPPPWYKLHGKGRPSAPAPPPPPAEVYMSYGNTLAVKPLVENAQMQGRAVLYSSDAPKDRVPELKKLNRLLLRTSLELIDAVTESSTPAPPGESSAELCVRQQAHCAEIIERISLIIANMHHLVHPCRPAEARRTLTAMMEVQCEKTAQLIRSMRSEMQRANSILTAAAGFSEKAQEMIDSQKPQG